MLNIKQLTNCFRMIALASLFVALTGLLISPIRASAADSCSVGMTPLPCGTVRVYVLDSQTGAGIADAKVVAYNPESGQSFVLYAASDDGLYSAQLRADEWKIYISSPGYSDAQATVMLEPQETEEVKVTLANSRRDVPTAAAND